MISAMGLRGFDRRLGDGGEVAVGFVGGFHGESWNESEVAVWAERGSTGREAWGLGLWWSEGRGVRRGFRGVEGRRYEAVGQSVVAGRKKMVASAGELERGEWGFWGR